MMHRYELHVVDTCASTQQQAADLLSQDQRAVHIVRARRQLAGRGRGDRSWHSQPGALLMSVAFTGGSASAQVLEPLCETIVWDLRRVLAGHAGIAPSTMAWSAPNDLVEAASAHKLAGVLIDARTVGNRLEQLVVGIGVNIAGASFALVDGRRCATLEQICGRAIAHDDAALDALARDLAHQIVQRTLG